MTPYARRMTAAALLSGAIAVTGMATHPGDSDAAQSPVKRIAPGGNITSVVRATDRLGWPHIPQNAEVRDLTALGLWYGVSRYGRSGGVLCHFGSRMGRVRCNVRNPAGARLFDVVFVVYEDGSYRVARTVTPVIR